MSDGLTPERLGEYLAAAAEHGAENVELTLPGGVRVSATLRRPEPPPPARLEQVLHPDDLKALQQTIEEAGIAGAPGIDPSLLSELRARAEVLDRGEPLTREKVQAEQHRDHPVDVPETEIPPASDLKELAKGTGHSPADLFGSSG